MPLMMNRGNLDRFRSSIGFGQHNIRDENLRGRDSAMVMRYNNQPPMPMWQNSGMQVSTPELGPPSPMNGPMGPGQFPQQDLRGPTQNTTSGAPFGMAQGPSMPTFQDPRGMRPAFMPQGAPSGWNGNPFAGSRNPTQFLRNRQPTGGAQPASGILQSVTDVKPTTYIKPAMPNDNIIDPFTPPPKY